MESDPSQPVLTASVPVLEIADLHDQLMVAANDLDRLQRLLEDSSNSVLGYFYSTAGELQAIVQSPGGSAVDMQRVHKALEQLFEAVTGMQFQDMSSQLLTHTTTRLRNCTDRLAQAAMGEDDDGVTVVSSLPLRPNPVTQDEMDTGSIELF